MVLICFVCVLLECMVLIRFLMGLILDNNVVVGYMSSFIVWEYQECDIMKI